MNSELRESLISCVLLSAVVIIPSIIPYSNYVQYLCVYAITCLLVAGYLFYTLNRCGAFKKEVQEPNWKHLLILSPVIIGLLSFPLSVILYPSLTVAYRYAADEYFLLLLGTILKVLIDEMLFRIFFFKMIRISNRGLKILASAAIFAAFELFELIQGATVSLVIHNILFTFLLGIILGGIMEYGHCIYVCMIYHFIFDFITVDSCGIHVKNYANILSSNWISFIQAPILEWILPIVAVIYCIVVYFVYFRKKEFDYYVQ